MKRALVTSLAILAIASACGGSDGTGVDNTSSSGNTSSTSSSGGASSSGTGSSSGGTSSSGGSSGDPGTCTPTAFAPTEPAPLDIHILLDASGSMAEPATGGTKWTAVKTALKAFFANAKNSGVGVGLQIFPIVHAGTPASCTTDNDCVGGYGSCVKKACDTSANGAYLPCDASSDCPNNEACLAILECGGGVTCLQNGTAAGLACSSQCNSSGTPLATSQCAKKECFLEDYDEARIPIATLPGNAAVLTSNVDAMPVPPNNALTPTSAALAGSLAFALQHASANKDHAVALVLLSDGVPTRCPPYTGAGMASFVTAASGSATPVRTHVVGLLTPQAAPMTKPTFDAIASAGGTTAATIVLTNVADVAASLGAALDGVRSGGACVAKAPAGDLAHLEVRLADGAGTVIAKKASASGCDANGGWYFDVDPAVGAPKKVILCDATCTQAKSGTKVESRVTCP